MAIDPLDKSQSQSSEGGAGGRGVMRILGVLGVLLLGWLDRWASTTTKDDARLQESKELGFEPRDVSPRGFLYFLLATGVFLAVVSVVLIGLFAHYTKSAVSPAIVAQPFYEFRPLAPPPRIQTSPGSDIVDYREAEERLLHSSGWIDQKNGIARIPIDRAMELLLRQGFPTQKQSTAAPVMKTERVAKPTLTAKRSLPQRSENANDR